ncbi:outer membrane protein assembly factor BamA [methanotrophic endosymbiont of Bathymodiolus puteoserpentis (Logatchev)]|jgi:outer membrane protein insertion porin family|uniref:outer membrane protein assembly factor BamA n=1 Tax=methanotrophic endosymbiont of Bathymodiolus puteoserpentis (Logatchev) TaxID=343235 RepID=UPI0013CAB6FE|nr:outer membrane protein assembly factor BamA [methanotrophic endosymbiont of Bathymodiolus puteoserpentis (Logatchev)]SHE23542.1 Outer membrane protein assembly factor YaeT precursor [methanotrophic endosymbiont of Bathymodiolus puteoserpentis (Logatchev)]
MKFKFLFSLLFVLLSISSVVHSDETGFVVKDIQVSGLQRISVGTVFNYLPVNVGETLLNKDIAPAIRALFKTGFFKDITLQREGNVLLVIVQERPSISEINIEGNEDLSTEDLLTALKTIGLSKGKVFNRQILDKVEQELMRQYFSHGKYSVKIDTEILELERNRVNISINISEGAVSKIKSVNIVGNKVFAEDDLLKLFELQTSGWLSFYTKDDQYSKQKLGADLERLRSYYLDRGYINFTIKSTQVSMTPDKKDIYLTINIKEGDLFTLDKVKLSGNLVVDPEELIALLQVGPGEIFSRKAATQTSKAISDRLGEEGYAFANVNMVPDIHNDEKLVDMTFFVDPVNRVYVRRIGLQGNTKTRDQVLRREMRQMEGAWASSTKIERSKARLNRLGYFENVGIETPVVPGTRDQMDLNYSVTEKSSGNLMAGIGYSQTQGVIYNASITQDNIFGSGKRVSINFNKSNVSTLYSLGFTNPYFTRDGVSLGYNLLYKSTNANQANISNYLTDVISGGVNFGFPINENQRLNLGFNIKHTTLKEGVNPPPELPVWINANGDKFLTLPLSIGWVRDTLDRPTFPTNGSQQRLSGLVALPGGDLTYFKVSAKDQHYFSVAKDLVFKIMASAAYGDGFGSTDQLPFFENYFAGGVNSVRGFRDNTLGPRDHCNGTCSLTDGNTPRPYGGNFKVLANTELIFPVPFMSDIDSIRLSVFFDMGTVQGPYIQYHADDPTCTPSDTSCYTRFNSGISFGDFRYSTGVAAQWLSPFGALQVSYGIPLNDKPGDQLQAFQFSFGSQF